MFTFETIEVVPDNQIVTLWLNRPEVHNAFNNRMVADILAAIEALAVDPTLRALVIRGKGKSYCAGADIHWMREAGQSDYDKIFLESITLAKCLQAVYRFPAPVISVVHGSVMGGGIGLMAASDFAICAKNTRFAFSEVTIGLVPAVISSFVIRRIGETKAKELMLLGTHFDGEMAENWGLVNKASDEGEVDAFVHSFLDRLLGSSPQAIKSTKKLFVQSGKFHDEELLLRQAAGIISQSRLSKDGQEGMTAFLEKRRPKWE